jgi:hypothetical protein
MDLMKQKNQENHNRTLLLSLALGFLLLGVGWFF